MVKKVKCKTCGTLFEPKGPGDRFCSAICRTTGLFVGGGGDTSKPMSEEQKKALAKRAAKGTSPKREAPKRVTNAKERFPRVLRMFELPQGERWELAKTFTPEEADYARRVAKRMLSEEFKIDELIDWDPSDEGNEESVNYRGITGGSLGDSDDGSV